MNKKFKSFLSLVLAVTMLVSTLTVTPVMAAGYSNDTNAPVLTISPAPATGNTLTTVSAGSTITVSAQNASQITYWWDSDKAQTRSGSSISITVPRGTGKHRLNLEASNGSSSTGWRNYDYQVVSGGYNTNNNITVSPAPGAVARGTNIRVTGGYNTTYGWEYESQYNGTGNLSYSGTGIKKLQVTNNGQTYIYTYYFTEDTTAPRNLKVSQTSNVAAGSRLSVSASDANGIASIEYMWDGDSYTSKGMNTNGSWQVQVPNTTGTKTLYLLAKDDSRWHNMTRWTAFTVNVGYNNGYNNEYNNGYNNGYNDNYYDNGYNNGYYSNAPTINVSPNGGNVYSNQPLSLNIQDTDGDLYRFTYRWNNYSEITKTASGSSASLNFTVPNGPGTYTLYVTATDRSGNTTNRTYTFYVPNNYNDGYDNGYYGDNTKPVITVNPDPAQKKELYPGERIEFTSRDNESGIKAVAYAWDDDKYTEIPVNGVKSYTRALYAPTIPGTHNLWLAAMNGDGIRNEWVQKTYVVTAKNPVDMNKPEIEVDPDGGKVEPQEEIEIKVTDKDDDVSSITYYWEDEDGEELDDPVTKEVDKLTIKAPKKEGKYTLYVTAVDERGNEDKDEYDFKVSDGNDYPGDPDFRGNINPDVDGLRVEIRNATDKLKFEPEEEIKYYIDFYNAERTTAEDVEIVMELPKGFKGVEASDDGEITSGKITWEIGDLDGKKGGRFEVVVEYIKDIDEATRFTMPAEIYSNSKSKDESEVFNMIYEKGADGEGSHHAYVVGYPDGSFRPAGNITRAEMAAMLVKLFKLGTSASYSRFSDVPSDHWAAGVINTCVNQGLIDAYGNRFEPDAPATRAMFAIALARKLGVDDIEPIYINANDTEGHYAMREMEQLIRLGLIDGYRNGSAGPDQLINRAEAVTMLNKYAFRGGLKLNGNYNLGSFGYNYGTNNPYVFNDLNGGHWALDQILEAALNHSYKMSTDGNEVTK